MRKVLSIFVLFISILLIAGCSNILSAIGLGSKDSGGTGDTGGTGGTGTEVSSDITTATTWTTGSTYHLTASIDVTNSGSLTIQPGVTINIDSGCYLAIDSGATFSAVGTSGSPIVLRASNSSAHWEQIYFYGGAVSNTLKFVTVTGAGSGNHYAIDFAGGSVADIENCTIYGNAYGGINASGAGAGTIIKSDRFYSNTIYGLFVDDKVAFDNSNHFAASGSTVDLTDQYNALYFYGDVASTRTFDITEVPYLFEGSIDVTPAGSLTIDPGVTLTFKSGCYLAADAGSTLNATGTSGSPITFKGKNASTQWEQIYFYGGAIANTIKFATVTGAGSGSHYAIDFASGSVADIENCTIAGNAYGGIDASGAGAGTKIWTNTFSSNGTSSSAEPYDIYYDSSVSLSGNSGGYYALY